jgi:hypothetical protein
MSNDKRKIKDQKTAILPMLSVRKGASAIEFYKAAFGVREIYHLEDSSGSVVSRMSMVGALDVSSIPLGIIGKSEKNYTLIPEKVDLKQ